MKVIHGSSNWKDKKAELGVALGNFDGVHLGHQAILQDLVKTAQKKGWTPCVYTFEPHPAKVLAPKTAPLLIQTLEQKLEALEKMGVEIVILEPFDISFSQLTPKKFFHQILEKRLRPKALWVGYDFTFGVHRSGAVSLLETFCRENKIALHITEAQFANETLMSSTQIRTLIASGNVGLAAELLGRPFALIGSVVKGYGIGGKMGIHTANLHYQNELLPKTGIYITRTKIKTGKLLINVIPAKAGIQRFQQVLDPCPLPTACRGKLRRDDKKGLCHESRVWPSATSVGFNPTFPGKGFSVETHLIGFEGNLRDKEIEVDFLAWLREEWTFPNTETLAVQIHKDITEALKFHETLRHHR